MLSVKKVCVLVDRIHKVQLKWTFSRVNEYLEVEILKNHLAGRSTDITQSYRIATDSHNLIVRHGWEYFLNPCPHAVGIYMCLHDHENLINLFHNCVINIYPWYCVRFNLIPYFLATSLQKIKQKHHRYFTAHAEQFSNRC